MGSWTTAHSRPWDELYFLVFLCLNFIVSLFLLRFLAFLVRRVGVWGVGVGMITSLLFEFAWQELLYFLFCGVCGVLC